MKKFIISSEVLGRVLSKLSLAVGRNTALPVLSQVLCRVNGNAAEFIATDLEVTIEYRCEVEGTAGNQIQMLLPFEFLKKVVALTRSTPLSIELRGKKGFITGENDTYEMGTLDPAEDFPKLPELPKKNSIKLHADFIGWVNKALIAVSKDEKRPAIQKVCLDIKTDSLTIVATNAHMLCTRAFQVESKIEDELLVSPRVAKALMGLNEVDISWQKTHIGFKSEDLTIIATRISDKYVNYRAVIPDAESNLLLNRSDLAVALEKCSLSSQAHKQTAFLLGEKDGSVVLEAEDLDFERKIDVTIAGKYTGNVDKIALSASSLLALISQVDDAEVSLAIHSPSKAVLLRVADDPLYLGLIMPIAFN